MDPRHTLILLRHAKSDWSTGAPDHERPLAPRGLRQAPEAGRWLAAHVEQIDLAVVSTAERARAPGPSAAAELAAAAAGAARRQVYGASADSLLRVGPRTCPRTCRHRGAGRPQPRPRRPASTLAGSVGPDADLRARRRATWRAPGPRPEPASVELARTSGLPHPPSAVCPASTVRARRSAAQPHVAGRWSLPGTGIVRSDTSVIRRAAKRRQKAAARGFSSWNGISHRPGCAVHDAPREPAPTPRPRADRVTKNSPIRRASPRRSAHRGRSHTARRRAARGRRGGRPLGVRREPAGGNRPSGPGASAGTPRGRARRAARAARPPASRPAPAASTRSGQTASTTRSPTPSGSSGSIGSSPAVTHSGR